MAGVLKMTDNAGNVVDCRNFRWESDIEKLKENWKKRYGLRYNERNIIVEYTTTKEQYVKPKINLGKGNSSPKGKKNGRLISQWYYDRSGW